LRTHAPLRSRTGCGIALAMNPKSDDRFPGVRIAASAQIYGKVEIGSGSSVWPNAVFRAESQRISIGRLTNVQDFAMLHIGYEHPTIVGDFCSITHHATVHGATVGNDCLIGIGAVLMDGVVLGAGSIVAGGSVLTEGSVFAEGSIIAGIPAKVIGIRDSSRANRMNAWLYHRNSLAYARGDERAWDGPEFEEWKKTLLAEIERDEDRSRLDRI
jgi:carbonic anhydrase/acetyltransferase-like protein (isoleucine patch superfamily)